jgi:hypothetical protein
VKDKFRVTLQHTFAGLGSIEVYKPKEPGDILDVRQLTISTLQAVELILYFGFAAGDEDRGENRIRGFYLGVNSGAAPDLACLGAWAPKPGMPIRLYAGGVCDVHLAIEGGVVE